MKKLFSVAAIAALILSVSACGKKDAKAEEAAEQNVVNVDLQGSYKLVSLAVNIAATDSLFEEKNPENYVFALLNGANTVVVENDSIVYINSSALDPSANIQLQKIQ